MNSEPPPLPSTAASSPQRRRRVMKTSWMVRAADIVATRVITIGGVGTIVAVSLVFLFLAAVVVPLFLPASIDQAVASRVHPPHAVKKWGMDESRMLAWSLDERGTLRAFRLDNSEVFLEQALLSSNRITSAVTGATGDTLALGLADGSLAWGSIGFHTDFIPVDELPAEVKELAVNAMVRQGSAIFHHTNQGQFRRLTMVTELQPPVKCLDDAIVSLDYLPPIEGGAMSTRVHRFVVVDGQGRTKLCDIREKKNALTRKVKQETVQRDFPAWMNGAPIRQVLISSRGDSAYRIGTDGICQRFALGASEVQVMEQVDLIPNDGAILTVCGWILGRETLLCGDNQGHLQGWFRAPVSGAETPDGQRLVRAHHLADAPAPATCFCPSPRSRLLAVGYGDGSLRLYHMTSEKLALQQRVVSGEPLEHVYLAPREDGLLAASPNTLWRANLDPAHSDVSLSTLFLPVWYEGYERPMHTWQSSSATSAPELKLGLFVLVFGTLKATFYTMLFSAPIALVAAVYTSEFLHPRLRARVKPCIEMMASLPSVVLGFLAALVFAPFAEKATVAVLSGIAVIPFTFVLGGYLWQLLPRHFTLRFARYQFFALLTALPAGVYLSHQISETVERLLFAGNVTLWLDGQIGSATGGWIILLLPLSLIGVGCIAVTTIDPWLRNAARNWSRHRFAVVDLVKFLAGVGMALGLAAGVGSILSASGWDPRIGTLGPFGTYEQRNSLIVGFVMGFAVIPIIYTIADDAFHAVPNHLRSASLGAGATKWQTAIRIVLPTAMSGLFSALMVGLGRAVGETMIVLMAGGNTPVLDTNPFNGVRTMSANIAVELPEAVRDSTHYRTLFLSALTLFVLTFVVNTIAEIVRMRFRRRAVQL